MFSAQVLASARKVAAFNNYEGAVAVWPITAAGYQEEGISGPNWSGLHFLQNILSLFPNQFPADIIMGNPHQKCCPYEGAGAIPLDGLSWGWKPTWPSGG